MSKKLYIVSTYYHALISCVKQLISHSDADILVTDYIPQGAELAERIKESDLFGVVCFSGEISEYKPAGKLDYVFLQHRKNAEKIEHQLNFSFNGYDEINIFHDDIWAAHYLKDRKIKYRLIEDAFDSFKTISRSIFSYMLPHGRFKTWIKKTFRIGYVFCGMDKCTYEVEVNDIQGVEISSFAGGKLVEVPRDKLFNSLSNDDKTALVKIFARGIPEINANNTVLLLTQPLYDDGIVKSPEKQLEIYQRIAYEQAEDKYTLLVKPHPRDTVDYNAAFPNSVILDKNMPSEIIPYLVNKPFYKAVTLNSSSLGFIRAHEHIRLEGYLG